MLGNWTGTYKYLGTRFPEELRNRETKFTIEITDFDGIKFSGQVQDEPETGGMKGRRKEIIREELHFIIKQGFGTDLVCSEYGMTELLSQAYSQKNGIFQCPPWMKIHIREPQDPLSFKNNVVSGGVIIIK